MKNITLFFLLTSVTVGLGVLFAPENPASVSGKISSDTTALWVAQVELLDSNNRVIYRTLTDKNGEYHFDSLAEGSYFIRVSHPSYPSFSSDFFALQEGNVHTEDVSLHKPAIKAEEDMGEVEPVYPEGMEMLELRDEPAPKEFKTKHKSAPARGLVSEEMEVIESPETSAGTLTAGEINDFSKWVLWEDLTATNFGRFAKTWGFRMTERYPVQVTYPDGKPVVDAEVQLVTEHNEVVFMARTDNTGRAELWARMVPEVDSPSRGYTAIVNAHGSSYEFKRLDAYPNALNTLTIEGTCATSDIIDVAFVVDATGSMGDEINYLKTELQDVIQRVQQHNNYLNLRTAAVFYRDHHDAYLTRQSDFSEDVSRTLAFIRDQHAAGGGDFPEAVDDALEAALNKLSWSPEARGRLLFLVLDAPPHQADSVIARMHQLVYKAAAMGVRIIPVTGSGINKDVEFLMRSMALATNGTYTFLTDHSGVGNKHLAPSTDSFQVEKLNDLLVRLINRYAQTTGCSALPPLTPIDSGIVIQPITYPEDFPKPNNDTLTIQCFPVPTNGPISFHVNKPNGVLTVFDGNGKLIQRFDMREMTRLSTDLRQFSAGTYYVRYEWQGRQVKSQIYVYH